MTLCTNTHDWIVLKYTNQSDVYNYKICEYFMELHSPLIETFESTVRPWLDMIDNLRSIGLYQDIPLPQIAVVGDQSSGKSSVLEAISGIPFPRGYYAVYFDVIPLHNILS